MPMIYLYLPKKAEEKLMEIFQNNKPSVKAWCRETFRESAMKKLGKECFEDARHYWKDIVEGKRQ